MLAVFATSPLACLHFHSPRRFALGLGLAFEPARDLRLYSSRVLGMATVIDLAQDAPSPARKHRVSGDLSAAAQHLDAAASEDGRAAKPRRKKKKRAPEVPADAPADALPGDADAPAEDREEGEIPAGASASNEDGESAPPPDEARTRRKKRKERAETNGSTDEPRRRRSKRSPSPPPADEDTLFFVDVTPVSVPSNAATIPPPLVAGTSATPADASALLLPAHVSILPSANGTSLTVEIISEPEPHSDEEDFIEYLDYDDRKVCIDAEHFPSLYLSRLPGPWHGSILRAQPRGAAAEGPRGVQKLRSQGRPQDVGLPRSHCEPLPKPPLVHAHHSCSV
jgi:hypothetical protein